MGSLNSQNTTMKKRSTKLSAEIESRLRELAEQQLDELWDASGDMGIWVQETDLPTIEDVNASNASNWFTDVVSPERLRELEGGSTPTSDEMGRLRESKREFYLSGDGDADSIPGYALAEVEDDMGNRGIALILRTGYSFSELHTWLEGVFPSRQLAFRYMKDGGWISKA